MFGGWWRQLWAESLGKNGKGSTPVSVPSVRSISTASLQLFRDGPGKALFTIMIGRTQRAKAWSRRASAPTRWVCDYLAGKQMGDLVDAEARATAQTLSRNSRPVRQIHVQRSMNSIMGALMMHFMLETILMGRLMGVDPFDQPGVEEGKVLARQYLDEKTNEDPPLSPKERSTASPPAKWSSVPPSAVKELVENALDAGARRIEIATSNGGADLILVEDDGEGMERDDLQLAVERHATSKLPRVGRRGRSHRTSSTIGLSRRGAAVDRRGGAAFHRQPHRRRARRTRSASMAACVGGPRPPAFARTGQPGTRVEVRELFFATPARLKFLKSARSEDLAIARHGQAARHGAARCRLHTDDGRTPRARP